MKKAIITGITGQDGAYLARYLLDIGYKVYGGYRRAASANFWRLKELNVLNDENFSLVEFELSDPFNILKIVSKIGPDEIYNLAAQSFVGTSFNEPFHTANVTGLGTLNILEAINVVDRSIRFYQASTSEMFGKVQTIPQNENTPFYPRSPYGVAKLYAHFITVNYKESYGIFASSGILFNHESELRGLEFVTRKITKAAAKIALKKQEILELGNLDAKRDWGYAKEYVVGMHKMLQAKNPDNYVLATGVTTTVREFVKMSFEAVDIELKFEGSGINEVARDKNGKILVRVNPKFFRPAEVDLLLGDASKAKKELGWEAKTDIAKICKLMIESDLKRAQNDFPF